VNGTATVLLAHKQVSAPHRRGNGGFGRGGGGGGRGGGGPPGGPAPVGRLQARSVGLVPRERSKGVRIASGNCGARSWRVLGELLLQPEEAELSRAVVDRVPCPHGKK
jgi:hypothetical protein